jgi:prepilin-type N-terminal cleavage/methylation domain-containing protein
MKTSPQISVESGTRSLSSGFSLVEVLVAAMVISIALFSVIAMVRKGQELIGLDRHLREARGIIVRTLESPGFQPENYNNILTGSATQLVTIDSHANLKGSCTITINAEQPVVNGVSVPHREIDAIVSWIENSGSNTPHNESVRVVKWLANVQRQ